jgi:hypothetical protein
MKEQKRLGYVSKISKENKSEKFNDALGQAEGKKNLCRALLGRLELGIYFLHASRQSNHDQN